MSEERIIATNSNAIWCNCLTIKTASKSGLKRAEKGDLNLFRCQVLKETSNQNDRNDKCASIYYRRNKRTEQEKKRPTNFITTKKILKDKKRMKMHQIHQMHLT